MELFLPLGGPLSGRLDFPRLTRKWFRLSNVYITEYSTDLRSKCHFFSKFPNVGGAINGAGGWVHGWRRGNSVEYKRSDWHSRSFCTCTCQTLYDKPTRRRAACECDVPRAHHTVSDHTSITRTVTTTIYAVRRVYHGKQ